MTKSWHYAQHGQTVGPIPEAQLKGLLASGQLGPDDHVWSEGMPGWAPARQVPDLIPPPAPFAPVPPPPSAIAAPLGNPYAPPQAAPRLGASEGRTGAVPDEAVELLRKTKPWARFLGVLGAIMTGFMILGALVFILLGESLARGLPVAARAGMGLVYLVMAGLQLPPVIFLNRYASRIGRLLQTGDPEDLVEALRAQKSFWRYVGIFTLVLLCFYALILVLGIGFGAMAATRRF